MLRQKRQTPSSTASFRWLVRSCSFEPLCPFVCSLHKPLCPFICSLYFRMWITHSGLPILNVLWSKKRRKHELRFAPTQKTIYFNIDFCKGAYLKNKKKHNLLWNLFYLCYLLFLWNFSLNVFGTKKKGFWGKLASESAFLVHISSLKIIHLTHKK